MLRRCVYAVALLILGCAACQAAEIEVYQGVVLTAQPERPDEVTSYFWLVDAPDRRWVPVRTEDGGRVAKFFPAHIEAPGVYRAFVLIQYAGGGEQQFADFQIGPTPPPPPPPPSNDGQVMIWIESDETDNLPQSQRDILAGRKFRDDLKAAGHYLVGILDYDSVVTETQTSTQVCEDGVCRIVTQTVAEVPLPIQAYWEKAQGDPMPWVVVAPKEGGGLDDLREFALPASAGEFLGKLEELQ